MSELMPGAPNACPIACPTEAARALGELSRQYVAPEKWLFSNPEDRQEIGLFSVDAVRTVVTNYHVTGSADHARYGEPREYVDMDQVQLASMQRGIQQGKHIDPEGVLHLNRMASKRISQRNAFAKLPAHEQGRYAAVAKPFLDEVAVTLLDKNPEFADLQELAAILKAREEKDEVISVARDIVASTRGIDRVHALDQGPFLIARQALRACGGPLAYVKPWLVLPGGYPLGTKTGTICPNGSARDTAYFTALHQSEQQNQ